MAPSSVVRFVWLTPRGPWSSPTHCHPPLYFLTLTRFTKRETYRWGRGEVTLAAVRVSMKLGSKGKEGENFRAHYSFPKKCSFTCVFLRR